jgi:hypothetical protein
MADDQAFGNVTVRWSDIWEDPTDLIFPETSPTAWSAGRLWSSAIALVIHRHICGKRSGDEF